MPAEQERDHPRVVWVSRPDSWVKMRVAAHSAGTWKHSISRAATPDERSCRSIAFKKSRNCWSAEIRDVFGHGVTEKNMFKKRARLCGLADGVFTLIRYRLPNASEWL